MLWISILFLTFSLVNSRLIHDYLKRHIHRPPDVMTYDRPVPSTSTLLDLNQDSYLVDKLPGLLPSDFRTSHWAGQIPIPYHDIDHYGTVEQTFNYDMYYI